MSGILNLTKPKQRPPQAAGGRERVTLESDATMNATQASTVPSISKNLCRFQNVSGDIVLISCTASKPQDEVYDQYEVYDYEHYNFTDEQWGIVRQLNMYYVPLLIVVGFVGNLLSCVVFLNTRLRMRSSSYYLAALAIADVTYLFILFLVWLDLLGFNTFNVNVMCQVSPNER